MLYRLLSMEYTYNQHFGQPYPPILEWISEFAAKNEINLDDLRNLSSKELKLKLRKIYRKKLLEELGYRPDVELSDRKSELLETGNMTDNFIIRFYCGSSAHLVLYVNKHRLTANCPVCNVTGTQTHFVNACTVFDALRKRLLEHLRGKILKRGGYFADYTRLSKHAHDKESIREIKHLYTLYVQLHMSM